MSRLSLVGVVAAAVAATAAMCVTLGCAHAATPVTATPARDVAAAHGTAAIRHVFLLMLENQSFTVSFGAGSPAPYLADTLRSQGVLLSSYYGIGHASLDDYIALISGQAPNPETQGDCPVLTEFQLSAPGLDAQGLALGRGCLYPAFVPTLPDQLEAAALSWRGYMEDMGNDPARESATCAHSPAGSRERSYVATLTDKYASRHNPFIYFHSIIDDAKRCSQHVVSLDKLAVDLRSADTTPNFAFITPNLCNDGHDTQCIGGALGGLQAVDAFLRKWVPLITDSAAFKSDGLLIITFDESDSTGADASTACCGEKPLPGAVRQPGNSGPGGGKVGAVLLSPFIKPGSVTAVPYNHYSTLRSIEDLFGLEHLGYAGADGLQSFGPDVFTQR